MSLITAESQMERLTAGPPNIPADRLAFLRKAYMETLADPALLSDAKRQDLPIVPANGDETEKLVKVALDQSPATIKFLAEAAGSQ
jgi:tripartite-type tricarboxylate transporter receptor subunit TctC